MLNTLLKHRSIRKYTDRDIAPELLNEIIEAGTRASNTGNMQLYSVVATRSAHLKEQLAPAHFNQPMVTNAPVVLTFCADVNRFTKWCNQRNADVGFNNFESLLTAIVDTCLFAQNVCLAAEDKGLGICYLGTTTYNADKISDVLNLPKGVVPVTTVTLGYPEEEGKLSDRLPVSGVLHNETYSDYTPEDIDTIYARMEQDPENAKYVEENKKENLAQVFAEVRYTKSANEHFSEVMKQYIARQEML